MDASFRVGEHVGFRAFTVRGSGLWSIGYGRYEWVPGVNEAHCDRVGKRTRRTRRVWVNDPMDPDGLIERAVEAGDHGRIPSPTCECGFYAYRSEALARVRLGGAAGYAAASSPFGNFGVPENQLIIGEVKLWGRVIRGTDGYRAQFASIVALLAEDPGGLDDVRKRYGITATAPNENVATGYVTTLDRDNIHLQTVREDLGWYVLRTETPELGQQVTVEFEERGAERWITSLYAHHAENE